MKLLKMKGFLVGKLLVQILACMCTFYFILFYQVVYVWSDSCCHSYVLDDDIMLVYA